MSMSGELSRSNHSSRREIDDNHSMRGLLDDASVEILLAERSHRSRRSRGMHSEGSHGIVSELSLAEYSYHSRQRSIPELLTLEPPPRTSHAVPEVLSLPGHRRRPSHGNSTTSRHTREAAASLPDRLPNHLASFGGLSLDHPSQHSRTPSLNNGDPIRNIVLRDKVFPSVPPPVPETSTSEADFKDSAYEGSLHRRPNSKRNMSFAQASYFYGNGVIVSGGPPDEVSHPFIVCNLVLWQFRSLTIVLSFVSYLQIDQSIHSIGIYR